jgi:hypothetical protein
LRVALRSVRVIATRFDRAVNTTPKTAPGNTVGSNEIHAQCVLAPRERSCRNTSGNAQRPFNYGVERTLTTVIAGSNENATLMPPYFPL